jgi:hypothetical protein
MPPPIAKLQSRGRSFVMAGVPRYLPMQARNFRLRRHGSSEGSTGAAISGDAKNGANISDTGLELEGVGVLQGCTAVVT